MSNVLIIASNYGLWAEELQGPWDALRKAGHRLSLATPTGKTPLPQDLAVGTHHRPTRFDERPALPHATPPKDTRSDRLSASAASRPNRLVAATRSRRSPWTACAPDGAPRGSPKG